VATTTPWRTLSVTGTVGFDGLTGATGAGSLCLDSNKQVVYNSASDNCLSSTRETKHDIQYLGLDSLSLVELLQPVSFVYNQGDGRTRYGFIAEDTAAVDEHLATYNASGTVSGIDDRSILAIVVGALKDISSITGAFKANLISWLADTTNGIKSFFAEKVFGDELCAKKSDGTYECITGDQLTALLSAAAAGAAPVSVSHPASETSGTGDQNPSSDQPVDLTNSEHATSTELTNSVPAATSTESVSSESTTTSPADTGLETPALLDDGEHDEETEVEEGSARSQPGEETEPVVHGTVPALEPANNNGPAIAAVPAPANDNQPAEPIPAIGYE
jgi:hypothetical protein